LTFGNQIMNTGILSYDKGLVQVANRDDQFYTGHPPDILLKKKEIKTPLLSPVLIEEENRKKYLSQKHPNWFTCTSKIEAYFQNSLILFHANT
jgi:hypothetical protein